MKKRAESLVKALLADNTSAERLRAALLDADRQIAKTHKSVEEKRKEIDKDIKNGARITKHRFHL